MMCAITPDAECEGGLLCKTAALTVYRRGLNLHKLALGVQDSRIDGLPP